MASLFAVECVGLRGTLSWEWAGNDRGSERRLPQCEIGWRGIDASRSPVTASKCPRTCFCGSKPLRARWEGERVGGRRRSRKEATGENRGVQGADQIAGSRMWETGGEGGGSVPLLQAAVYAVDGSSTFLSLSLSPSLSPPLSLSAT
jgi:hypothetical protein